MATLVDILPFPDVASCLPDADRTSLVGLSDNDIRAWSAAKADEYRGFALALLSVYNAVAPINRLPFEILSKIFEGCWTDRKSLRIGHICRRWRSVLLSTSGFWAEAVKGERFTLDDHSTGCLGVMFERSAPRMVAPSFCRFSACISPCLAPYLGKISSLVVSLADFDELFALWTCLNSGMNNLDRLTIALMDDASWTRIPRAQDQSLLPTSLPCLTRVSAPAGLLHRFAIPSLQHITLETVGGQHTYFLSKFLQESYRSFRDAMAVCAANLETLDLSGVAPLRGEHEDTTPLSLPALRHLFVCGTARHCSSILSLLVLPPTTYIQCINTDAGNLCDTVPLNVDSIRSSLSAIDMATISVSSRVTTVYFHAGHDISLSIGLPGRQRGLQPDDLVRFLRHTAPVTELVIRGRDGRDIQGVDFRAFPHLLRVSIIALGDVADPILGHLARSDGDDENLPVRAVCPELKTLSVDLQFQFQEDGDGLGPAIRDQRESVVEADFRKRCATLERVLSRRAEMGTRLTRLEFWWTEKKWPADTDSETERTCILRTSYPNEWAPWAAILEPLEKLVDGPVVVKGYPFYPEGDW